MSEVNQAFLRAYLKNRTQNPPKVVESNPGASSHQQPPNSSQHMIASSPEDLPARPRLNSGRPTINHQERSARVLENGMQLRVDPSHQQTPIPPATAGEPIAAFSPAPNRAPVPQGRRQGVWGPLGPERGMKAMEPVSLPAIISNGIVPVADEATRTRRPLTNATAKTSSGSASHTNPSIAPQIQQSASAPPPRVNVPYDQVMYVDGLANAPAQPHLSRAPKHTLNEISQPIAVGTGLPNANAGADMPIAKSSSTVASNISPTVSSEFVEQSTTENRTASVNVNRRFDAPHLKAAPTEPPREMLPAHHDALTLDADEPELVSSKHSRLQKEQADTGKVQRDAQHTTNDRHVGTHAANNNARAPIPLPVAFTPSWEVDTFFWPEVLKKIEAVHKDAFRQISKHLQIANRDGLKVMAITSGERGVGRSTVAMHMARCAAASGLKVALVDGDTFCPSLVDQLRLDIRHGWQDCLFENVPLSEVAVHSIADNITLFPLTAVVPAHQMHANLHRMAKMIKRISTAFEMVFIDSSRLNLEQRDLVGVGQESIIDAAIVVVDTELSIKEKVDSAVGILQGMGISSIGLVENFQS